MIFFSAEFFWRCAVGIFVRGEGKETHSPHKKVRFMLKPLRAVAVVSSDAENLQTFLVDDQKTAIKKAERWQAQYSKHCDDVTSIVLMTLTPNEVMEVEPA